MLDPKPRILIVDDDHNILALTERILKDAGFLTEAVDGGRAAIEKVEASRPTLMTLDLLMPDVDGWGVLAHLRRVSAPPPVVVVTGHPESVGPFSVMASVAAYVVKPFSPDTLVATCRKVVAGLSGLSERRAEPDERRGESRRLFVVEARVASPPSASLATGHIVDVSPGGLRLDLETTLEAGHSIDVAFMLPGHKNVIKARCLVHWRQGVTTGLKVVEIGPRDAECVHELMKPLGTPRRYRPSRPPAAWSRRSRPGVTRSSSGT